MLVIGVITVLVVYSVVITLKYLKYKNKYIMATDDVKMYELLASQKQYTEILRKSNRDKVGEWKKR